MKWNHILMKKKKYKTAFFIAANSDIALELIKHYQSKNWKIYGTYRSENQKIFKLVPKENLIKVDLKKVDTKKLKVFINKIPKIDLFTCLSQRQLPFGDFFSNNFKDWKISLNINMLGPLEILQLFKKKFYNNSSIIFFTGGGPNKATKNYSSYSLSKFALIKFTELLSEEYSHLKVGCINPGWVKTKAHKIFLKQIKLKKTEDYKKLKRKFLKDDFIDVKLTIKFFDWFLKSSRSIVSGKYFVADFDKFGSKNLHLLLRKKNIFKMRRLEI